MEQSTKDNGCLDMLKVTESSFMLMGMCMREIGEITKLTEKEFTQMQKELDMKVRGKMINNMGKELRCGMRALNMRVFMILGRNKDMESTHGQMGLCMRDYG